MGDDEDAAKFIRRDAAGRRRADYREGGRILHALRQVVGKTENRTLGDLIWPVVGENPWELIYFLRNVRQIRIPKDKSLPALGYTNVNARRSPCSKLTAKRAG